MDANVTVLPSQLDARRMGTVLVLTRVVLSGATFLCLVQPVLTPEAVASTAQGSREESGHMKPVPPQLYPSITTITNITTVFNGMDKIAISVLHTSTTVVQDSTTVVLDSTTVVQDSTTVVLGEDAAIVDQVDPDLTVVAPGEDATTMADLDSIMVAPVGDATMVDLASTVGVTMGVL